MEAREVVCRWSVKTYCCAKHAVQAHGYGDFTSANCHNGIKVDLR